MIKNIAKIDIYKGHCRVKNMRFYAICFFLGCLEIFSPTYFTEARDICISTHLLHQNRFKFRFYNV